MTMLTVADKTVHQHEIAHGQRDRLDRPLRNDVLGIEHRHVRREMHIYPAAKANLHHGRAKHGGR